MKLLADLRNMVPQRRLSPLEAYGIAERQAYRLLRRAGVTSGPVPNEVITDLPFVTVAVRSGMRSSGATHWFKPRWVILLNGLEAPTRQRFSLAHEFFHIVCHPYADAAFGRADTPTNRLAREKLCDYFAACLLMPRPWVKEAFFTGLQDVVELAERFEVSPQAMHVRLQQLGLVDAYGRCRGIDNTYLRSRPVSPLEPAA